jgi:hypothetical protein
MTSTNTTAKVSTEDVAKQFDTQALEPRFEIWSKEVENEHPSVPTGLDQ